MRRTAAISLALTALPALAAAEQKPIKLDDKTALLQPITHDNLTLFPVITTAEKVSNVDYLVLDEGMKKKLVQVLEKDSEGSVNELTIRNTSSRPLFLMAGEVVIGGKQDRIIGKNTIVAPRTTETVPVFCVEHGRWNGRKAEFASAGSLAHTELRKKANFDDQGEVWKEVKSKNAKRKVANDTDTYRRITADKTVAKSIDGYQKALAGKLKALGKRDRQIGFVVALGGEVVAIETFGSPRLFRKFERKLLRSYYVEAVDGERGVTATAPKPAAVSDFAARARKAKREVVLDKKSGKTAQFSDETVKGTAVEYDEGEEVYEGTYK